MKDWRIRGVGQMIEFCCERIMEQSEYDREDLQVSETREGGRIWRRRGNKKRGTWKKSPSCSNVRAERAQIMGNNRPGEILDQVKETRSVYDDYAVSITCAGNKTRPLIRVSSNRQLPLRAGRVAMRSTALSLTATEGFAGPIEWPRLVYTPSSEPVLVLLKDDHQNRWIMVDSHPLS
jgi:hypothetical protein